MTERRRILFNVIATYGRSLVAMICGLFASRWALATLGVIDYGLYGVIGGLVFFVTFLDSVMSSAIGRFYAYSVGAARSGNPECCEECVRWFNVAVMISALLPTLLVLIGYPAGVWVIEHFLVVPLGRMSDCIWVWRITCVTNYIAMCTVPFSAMFVARQEIAELTVYGILSSLLQITSLYYMVSHPGSWLVGYAVCMSAVSVIPKFLFTIRAFFAFKECKLCLQYMWSKDKIKLLCAFAGSRILASLARLLSIQGLAVLVNKGLGPARNATLTMGTVVNNQTMTLASAFCNALQPAITNAVGEGRRERAIKLSYAACTLSTMGCLVFLLPLSIEIDQVLGIWLSQPPEGLTVLTLFILGASIFQRMTDGLWMLILAKGRIAKYQLVESCTNIIPILAALIFIIMGNDIVCVGWSILLGALGYCTVQLYFSNSLCDIRLSVWLQRVFMPITLCALSAFLCGYMVKCSLLPNFFRIVIVTIVVELVLLPSAWFFVLGRDEREQLYKIFFRLVGHKG